MTVALIWLALAVALTALEIAGRRSSGVLSLSELARRVAERRAGRLLLVLCWGFVGWHFFARSTVPPL